MQLALIAGLSGFGLGVMSVMLVGAPPFAPSYLELHAERVMAQQHAHQQMQQAEAEALRRKAQHGLAVDGVRAERSSCTQLLDDQAEIYRRALEDMETNLERSVPGCPDRDLQSVRSLYAPDPVALDAGDIP